MNGNNKERINKMFMQDKPYSDQYREYIMRVGGGFHCDNDAQDYIHQDGSPLFNNQEVEFYNELSNCMFRIHGDNIYTLAMQMMDKLRDDKLEAMKTVKQA